MDNNGPNAVHRPITRELLNVSDNKLYYDKTHTGEILSYLGHISELFLSVSIYLFILMLIAECRFVGFFKKQ